MKDLVGAHIDDLLDVHQGRAEQFDFLAFIVAPAARVARSLVEIARPKVAPIVQPGKSIMGLPIELVHQASP